MIRAIALAVALAASAPAQADPPGPPPAEAPASIGSATIDEAGVITLTLRAEGPGVVGDALFTYRPGDREYDEVLRHIGPIRPGETRQVPPWPDDPQPAPRP
jgi:hypothetical protein